MLWLEALLPNRCKRQATQLWGKQAKLPKAGRVVKAQIKRSTPKAAWIVGCWHPKRRRCAARQKVWMQKCMTLRTAMPMPDCNAVHHAQRVGAEAVNGTVNLQLCLSRMHKAASMRTAGHLLSFGKHCEDLEHPLDNIL